NSTVWGLAINTSEGKMYVGGDFTDAGGNGNGDYLASFTDSDNSLPVTLSNFSAKVISSDVVLSWSTESETENLGFIIEKRLQVTGDRLQVADYTTDEALQGHGSTSEAHEYLYTDAVVAPGMTYAYRLADVDYSGKVTWHKEIEVKVEAESEKIVEGFHLGEVFPNPFNATFTIPLTLSKSSPVKLTLCDLNGKVVKIIENSFKPAGEYRIAVDCSDLGSGIYFVQLAIRNNNEIRKMVLIK
ncbi:MAG: T9SS type A sorting domain-containing protein, partial [bacterium]